MTQDAQAQPDISRGLFWVKGELSHSLERIRGQIETYLEEPQDKSPLESSVGELQQLASIAEVIQCFSAHMLAREMQISLQAVLQGKVESEDPSFSALISATLQLSDYIDLLAHGEADHPLIFAPNINDLRLARGESVLSRAAMFAGFMRARGREVVGAPNQHRKPGMSRALARKHVDLYQKALLGVLRQQNFAKAVDVLAKLANQLRTVAVSPEMYLGWSGVVVAARALQVDPALDNPDIHTALAKSGKLVKALAAQGEPAVRRAASELGAQLMYLATASEADHADLARIRGEFELDAAAQTDSHLQNLRRRLAKPNVDALQAVARELRSSLEQIKDAIDLAIRSDSGFEEDGQGLMSQLQQLGTTLGVVGLDSLGQLAERQADHVGVLIAEGRLEEPDWMAVAEVLLRIEHGLEAELLPSGGSSRGGSGADSGQQDLREGIGALLRESLINLNRIKVEVDRYIAQGEAASLATASDLLKQVASAFVVLGRGDAGPPMQSLVGVLEDPSISLLRESPAVADRFADVVASIEYYVEAVQENQPNSDALLADIAEYVSRLRAAMVQSPAVAPEPEQAADKPADNIDPEFREIFIEEAREVLGELNTQFPRWKQTPESDEVLADIRRAFHTLKGSGRMVGATDIGEFGWALEDLLNRTRDGALTMSQEIVDVVGDAVAALPEVIEHFAAGESAEAAVAPLVARAHVLVHGEPIDDTQQELRGVFVEDSRENLGDLNRRLEESAANEPVDEAMVRLFHTLRGGAGAAELAPIAELAEAAENCAKALKVAEAPFPLELLRPVHQALVAQVEKVAADDVPAAEAELIQRLKALQHAQVGSDSGVDEELVEIFSEEAMGLLEAAEADLAGWRDNPDSAELPEQLQRHFHTLKGSARTAGAMGIGTAGEALDLVMKDVVAGRRDEVGEALFNRLSQSVLGIYDLLDAFREGHDADPQAVLDLLGGDTTAPAGESAPPAGDAAAGEVAPAEADVLADLPAAENEPEPAGAAAADADLAAEQPAAIADAADDQAAEIQDDWPPDPDILELFVGEGHDLLESMDQQFAAWEDDQRAVEALRGLQRDLHTFKGSARMAGLHSLGAVAHEMESEYAALEKGSLSPEPLVLGRLHQAIDSLFGALDQLRSGQHPEGAQQLLQDLQHARAQVAEADVQAAGGADVELLAADAQADTEPADSLDESKPAVVEAAEDDRSEVAVSAEPSTGHDDELSAAEPVTVSVPESPEAPADGAQDASTPADAAADTAAESPMSTGIGTAADDRADVAGDIEGATRAEDASADAPAVSLPDTAAADAPDEEMVEIFLPEAQELLEAFDGAVSAARERPEDTAQLDEMLRVLHTFKGGARMSGLNRLGDDAHNLESGLEALRDKGAGVGADWLDRLQHASDRFHGQLDQARGGVPLSQPETPEQEAPSPVEEAVASEPVAAVGGSPDSEPQAAAEAADDAAPVWSEALNWQPPEDERLAAIRKETARVGVEQLDKMLNEAGEISIYRARLEQQITSFAGQLREVDQTVERIREQLRMLESETDAQIQARQRGRAHDASGDDRYREDFDPLEMDRYSRMQELTRALSESVTDLASLHATLSEAVGETDALLLQQGRVNTSVQQGLMGTLMVPFARQVQRLQRVLRQAASDNGKNVELRLDGIDAEMDRNVLERMTPVIEHVIRNCVVHGIEAPAQREASGKPARGQIAINLWRDGSKLAIEIDDDGAGLNFPRIRQRAIDRGLMSEGADPSEAELAQFIFQPGFSTAEALTKDAGRGVGMDVVASEVKQLGGTLDLDSQTGKGARFLIRLPLSLAISQALLVQVGEEIYATPLSSIEGIARIPADSAEAYLSDQQHFQYGDQEYRVRYLGDLLGSEARLEAPDNAYLPVILVHTGEGMGLTERRVAIVIDQLLGSRELVTKTAGPQVSSVVGVTGATIQADGRVVLILDVVALVQDRLRRSLQRSADEDGAAVMAPRAVDLPPLVMVIDDSITMRRVAERVLTRNGYRVATAKDGMDGIAQLQTDAPDAVLLDIEMPKVDGFEVATFIRNNPDLARVPIVMITSRSGDKHRERAKAIGVNRYLIKPYQEQQLIDELKAVLAEAAN